MSGGQTTLSVSKPSRMSVRKVMLFATVVLIVVVLDQATKWAVRSNFAFGEAWSPGGMDFVRIVHLTNSGAAFGIFQGEAQLVTAIGIIGIAAILFYFLFPPMDHPLLSIALAMLLGGALGNLTDRLLRGEVTDWIDVGSWPTFNLADSSITISIIAILAFLLFDERLKREPDHGRIQ